MTSKIYFWIENLSHEKAEEELGKLYKKGSEDIQLFEYSKIKHKVTIDRSKQN